MDVEEVKLINDLGDKCLKDGKVVLAERTFGTDEYTWHWKKHEVLYIQAKLGKMGITSDIWTEMDDKGSKIVLKTDGTVTKEVMARVIKP